jgi:cell division GTPase FtsZ
VTDLFSTSSDVLVMGVGTLGGRIAAAGEADCARATWSAAHTDAAALLATGLERKLLLRCDAAVGSPFAARALERSIAERISGIRGLTSGRNVALLVGAADEGHSGVAMAELAHVFASQGMVVCVVAVMENNAPLEVLETIQARAPICIHLPAQQLLNGIPGDQPLSNIQSGREKKLLFVVETLASVLGSGSTGGFGAFEFSTALRGCGALRVGIGIDQSGQPREAVSQALQDAGAANDLGKSNGVAAAIVSHAELTAGDAAEIEESIRWQTASETPLIGHATHGLCGNESCCVLLARQTRAAKPAFAIR